jgi:hypothetical protein
MMILTYFALKPQSVGDVIRQPGELIPEARDWNFLSGYITNGEIAPVLVATLPEETQQMLAEWEADQDTKSETAIPEPLEPPEAPEVPEPDAPEAPDAPEGDDEGAPEAPEPEVAATQPRRARTAKARSNADTATKEAV